LTPTKSEIDGIEVLTVTRKNAIKTIVLMHGFGASYEDLSPLADVMDRGKKYNWIFPNGIVRVPMGPYVEGRAWFPIRMAEIEAAAARGSFVDFTEILPDGMKEAERRINSLFDSMHLDRSQTIIGGFSQGAMMSMQVALSSQVDFAGVILFSGTFINAKEWRNLLSRKTNLKFFQSHGISDPILSFSIAEKLSKELKESKMKTEFHAFSGHHEIPMDVISKSIKFCEGAFG
jgi:phospholipase/carboxylesterase